ncbi:CoA-binding protein [Flavobacterium selenitireducens]|uniref:CoA-binding protein n=1 Tax=Flavobacterium selenitireducens TaxID=2722704 RepID=UPI00168AE377|nr:CoA-binding protein [Flavobacterium selenitireducens]MBD3583563.1 CoA-binding protein [Flavobacterium selenitireducens]
MAHKKTMILGATNNPGRYAFLAATRLIASGHTIVNIGVVEGEIEGIPIQAPKAIHEDIDTITMYIGAARQTLLYDYILETKPRRIIFNPGSENPGLERLAIANGIVTERACTLVLLATAQF